MGEPVTAYIGGKTREFQLLKVTDFVRLYSRLRLIEGVPSSAVITDHDLLKWAQTALGSSEIIAVSLKRGGVEVDPQDVLKWGSMMQRHSIASETVARSMNEGEEIDPAYMAQKALTQGDPGPKVESGDQAAMP